MKNYLSVLLFAIVVWTECAHAHGHSYLYRDSLYGLLDPEEDLNRHQLARVVSLSECDTSFSEALLCASRWGDSDGDGSVTIDEVEAMRERYLTSFERFISLLKSNKSLMRDCDIVGSDPVTGAVDVNAPPDGRIVLEEILSSHSMCLNDCRALTAVYEHICLRAEQAYEQGDVSLPKNHASNIEYALGLLKKFDTPQTYRTQSTA